VKGVGKGIWGMLDFGGGSEGRPYLHTCTILIYIGRRGSEDGVSGLLDSFSVSSEGRPDYLYYSPLYLPATFLNEGFYPSLFTLKHDCEHTNIFYSPIESFDPRYRHGTRAFHFILGA